MANRALEGLLLGQSLSRRGQDGSMSALAWTSKRSSRWPKVRWGVCSKLAKSASAAWAQVCTSGIGMSAGLTISDIIYMISDMKKSLTVQEIDEKILQLKN